MGEITNTMEISSSQIINRPIDISIQIAQANRDHLLIQVFCI